MTCKLILFKCENNLRKTGMECNLNSRKTYKLFFISQTTCFIKKYLLKSRISILTTTCKNISLEKNKTH